VGMQSHWGRDIAGLWGFACGGADATRRNRPARNSSSSLRPPTRGLLVPEERSRMREVVTDGTTLPRHVDRIQAKPWMLLTSV